MNHSRAEQIAKSINSVLIGYEAEVVPGPARIGDWDGAGYCVTIFDKHPVLSILCIFDDGECLFEPQEAVYVIDEWNNEARSWLTDMIAAEVFAEREASGSPVGDEAGDEQDAAIQG